MPVVNYANKHNTALAEFVASHDTTNSEIHDLSLRTFQGILGQPSLDPTKNCLVWENAGEIKEWALFFREFSIGRSIIEVMTSPELAGSPVELDLERRSVAWAEAEKLNVAHICVMPNSIRNQVLERASFTKVRAYLDMLWNQDQLPNLELPQNYSVRSYQEGDTPLLTRIQNDAFTGSWGFCPNTEEQVEYRTRMPNTSKAGILFLVEGDNPAGYCSTVLVPGDKGVRGMIAMIGVVPDYRGKGLSHHISRAEMKHLRSIGLTEIGLEVDGNNDPAVRLYRTTGFKKMAECHWLERVLPGTLNPERRNTLSSWIPPEITALMACSTLISVLVTSDADTITKKPDDGIGVVGM